MRCSLDNYFFRRLLENLPCASRYRLRTSKSGRKIPINCAFTELARGNIILFRSQRVGTISNVHAATVLYNAPRHIASVHLPARLAYSAPVDAAARIAIYLSTCFPVFTHLHARRRHPAPARK